MIRTENSRKPSGHVGNETAEFEYWAILLDPVVESLLLQLANTFEEKATGALACSNQQFLCGVVCDTRSSKIVLIPPTPGCLLIVKSSPD
jgi:hypothetical protein